MDAVSHVAPHAEAPETVLQKGPLYIWEYDEEADDKAVVQIAENYGAGANVDPQDAYLFLADLAPKGYELRREDGILGVWEIEDDGETEE